MQNPLDPSKVTGIGKTEEVAPVAEPEAILNTNIVQEAETHAIAHTLGIEKMTDMKKYQDQINRVYEWAKARGATSLTDIVTEINGLQNRVGNKNLFNIAVYAGLELERMNIESKMRKFER